jgi:hypothetical protein
MPSFSAGKASEEIRYGYTVMYMYMYNRVSRCLLHRLNILRVVTRQNTRIEKLDPSHQNKVGCSRLNCSRRSVVILMNVWELLDCSSSLFEGTTLSHSNLPKMIPPPTKKPKKDGDDGTDVLVVAPVVMDVRYHFGGGNRGRDAKRACWVFGREAKGAG